MQKRLVNCEMYKLLAERKESQLATALSGVLLFIEPEVAKTLEYIKVKFPNFTEHGIQHSLRIIEYIYAIMSDEFKQNISDIELFCFIMSALFHDMGMALSDVDNVENQRANHHLYAKEPIEKFFDKYMNFPLETERVKRCIVFACESHGKKIEEMYRNDDFICTEKIEGQYLRFGLLAIMLRIGDLMDLEGARACEFNMHLNPIYYTNAVSMEHNIRHFQVEKYNYDANKISVTILAKTRESHKIWHEWLKYLDEEIMYANTHYLVGDNCEFYKKYKFPKLSKEIMPDVNAKYMVEEIKFQVDESGALWDILTKSVYTNEFDYIRELIQNAIDATLLMVYLDEAKIIEKQSPRSWNNDEKIIVAYSEDTGRLFVGDTGIGMNEKELSSYLFKAADSGYKYKKQRNEFAFPSIAKFGIGFVSCLTKANRIQVLTHALGAECIRAEIESKSTVAYIDKDVESEMHGTFIYINVKNRYTFKELKEYINMYFKYPSVAIKLIDLDTMKQLSHKIDDIADVTYEDVAVEELYKYIYSMEKIEKRRREEVDKLEADFNLIGECRKIIVEDKNIGAINKIKDILNNIFYKSLIAENLKNTIVQIEKRKDSVKLITEVIIKMHNNIKTEMDKYPKLIYDINNKKLLDLADYKFLVLELNEEFEIFRMHKNRIHEKLGKRGIIYISTMIEDYDNGIEWKSVNAFLFNDGKIVKNLLKISSDKCIDNGFNNIISLDEIGDADYEMSMLFEAEEDENYYEGARKYQDYMDYMDYGYTYDVLMQKNNDFYLRLDVEGKVIEYIDVEDQAKNGYRFFDTVAVPSNYKGEMYDIRKSTLYQDGILLNCNPQNIVPIGVGSVTSNLTGRARFELNVSRHELDLSREVVEQWIKQSGVIIQEKVAKKCIDTFELLGLDYEEKDMISVDVDNNNTVLKECVESMRKVIKNLKKAST